MAQLPPSMRRKRVAATSSIHDKPPTQKERLLSFASWLLLAIAVMICALGLYALYTVMTDAKQAELTVTGEISKVEEQVAHRHLDAVITKNYFTTDLEQIRDHALELPWVERVVVARHWPNGIVVRLTPRHPIARWGTGRLLSDAGVVFTQPVRQNVNHLPLLHGPVSQSQLMMQRYHQINQLFAPMGVRLKELYLTERMTWFMQFDSGLRLIVDQHQTMMKLQRLSALAKNDLQPVWPLVAAVDLRYRNGMALQWKNSRPPKVVNGQFVLSIDQISTASQNGQLSVP